MSFPSSSSDFSDQPSPVLAALGFDAARGAEFAAHAGTPNVVPARVARVDRGGCEVLTATGTVRAAFGAALSRRAAADPAELPCTGDWAVVAMGSGAPGFAVEAVLERRTAFLRADASGRSRAQVLAANVDTVLIVVSSATGVDLGRIERLLALAWESGAQPVVVLTKADLTSDPEPILRQVAAAAPGAEVVAVSAVTGAGLADLVSHLAPGRTVVLIGPSGVGKSTLVNALAGHEVLATGAIRADGKGRHTTTHRALVPLPGGGVLIDTPGLRGVGLWDAADGLDRAFSDVEELGANCRFGDCAHAGEPGCAVLAAVEAGELPRRRLDSYRKLQREARWIASRSDARLRAEQARQWKVIHKAMRNPGMHR